MLKLLLKHHRGVHTFTLKKKDEKKKICECSIFQFEGEFYRQKHFLAMGLQIPPLLTAAYLKA